MTTRTTRITRSAACSLALLAFACASSCTKSATQVIVLIDAEKGVRADADHLHLLVQGRDGIDDQKRVDKLDETLKGKIAWPIKLAFVPANDDAGRVFWVEAVALDGTTSIATARLLSGYVDGETRYAKLLLEDDCRNIDCQDHDETCHNGECVSAFLEPKTLGKSAKNAKGNDAASQDAGGGDGGDADAGADASTSNDGGTSAKDGGGDSGPMSKPECKDSGDCGSDAPICASQKCRACKSAPECADRSKDQPYCLSGSCVACQSDADCGATSPICGADGACHGCSTNTQCTSLVCNDDGSCRDSDAVVYFKDTGSSNSSCGTFADPCSFFPDAQAKLDATRNVLHIGAGTYKFLKPVFNTPTAVRVVADGVVFNLLNGSQGYGVDVTGNADVTIQGLTIKNASSTTSGTSEPGVGVHCVSSKLRLQHVTLDSNTSQGVSSNDCALTVSDSLIDGNGGYGLQLDGGNVTVERTIIRANEMGGMTLFDGSSPGTIDIVNNLFIGNSSTSQYNGAIRGGGSGMNEVLIAFNTFTKNSVNQNYIGIIECGASFTVDSNIVWGNHVGSDSPEELTQTFFGCSSNKNSRVSNTLTEAANLMTDGSGGTVTSSNSTFSDMITSDPKFVDASADKLGLQSGSPALDKGTTKWAGMLDLAGKPRVKGSGPDLGCYER